ncbi:MAG: cytochrome b/b6 domain-containing protein [Ardenticatenaceae bacterium]|nr:cytochrome b/b6 domain-containing protein [Anaerolineales bacterium]MCB8917847.1 cytochrome b/b6 domain-containing protein [Ardenticatenaceae bacterium]
MSDVNLPLAERKQLKEKMLTKHHLANILTHWFNAVSWAFLLATGLAILGRQVYQTVPAGWSDVVRNVFGGLAPLIKWHESWGMFWAFIITFNFVVGFRKYFMPFGARRMMLDKDDLNWFVQYGRKLVGLSYELPPQDDYNAGQKAFSYVVLIGIVGIIITGLIMTFSHLIPISLRWLVQWAMPAHFTAVGMVVTGLVIHIYMGAIFPEERPAFFSMFSGKVHALYAYSHHRKWYNRYVTAEQEWEQEQVARDLAGHEQPDTMPPRSTLALDDFLGD